MRIVSLLPSATEILHAIGAGPDVVGVTFECDYPPQAREARIVSTSSLPEGLSLAEIDTVVTERAQAGEDLYHLDRGALAGLDADVVVTQDLCAVCAVDVSVVADALAYLDSAAQVVTTDPHTLEEVLASIEQLGAVCGKEVAAKELVDACRARLEAIAATVAGRRRPRMLVLEWTDPPFAPGHWIPEMVEVAGGVAALGAAGEKSRRVSWDDVADSEPEVVVVAPCGFDLSTCEVQGRELVAAGRLPAGVPVWAVDANASFARPGPRLVEGIEALASVLHPDVCGEPDPRYAARVR